jgi:hypothetical protein
MLSSFLNPSTWVDVVPVQEYLNNHLLPFLRRPREWYPAVFILRVGADTGLSK